MAKSIPSLGGLLGGKSHDPKKTTIVTADKCKKKKKKK